MPISNQTLKFVVGRFSFYSLRAKEAKNVDHYYEWLPTQPTPIHVEMYEFIIEEILVCNELGSVLKYIVSVFVT